MTHNPATPDSSVTTPATTKHRRFVVLCPHFAPDIAPTGKVMTNLVHEWAALGHEVHVVTSLPWYREHRVETAWRGRLVRREHTDWGSITRINPLASKSKSNLFARSVAFVTFSVVAGVCAITAGRGRARNTHAHHSGRIDAIIAMSPPLTLGIVGWLAALVRRSRLVFNVQDVFPDAAVKTGAVTNPAVIALASWLERFTYRRSAAVVVLSEDLRRNVRAKLPEKLAEHVHVIENFVDTTAVSPRNRMTAYRRELNLGDEVVVMYAGNVGFSQSLGALVEAARRLPAISFVINGSGSALPELQMQARDLPNVHFGNYQPEERLAEVLATADIHVVSLRTGLASVSVPSKTYSVLAAGRCVVAAVDAETEIARLVYRSGAGVAVAPDDVDALVAAITRLVADASLRDSMGRAGRTFVERQGSARDAARAYAALVPDSLSNS
ncbi:MAG: glycosyltransferase family 4 protein [Actinomycetota bacterium]